ncbi:MAG TPA: class I SAM-dependent methyltransferase [Terriglobales bacterium]|nr:class I SAM-dependent methyltransferase [Terriglobales bacterium]
MSAFLSTVPFYARYREPYPASFFEALAKELGLSGRERLLDVGCGPAQLAIGFAPFAAECTCVDPEGAMLAEARSAASRANIDIEFIQSRVEDLPEDVAQFDVVTIGRAIHWIERERALPILERIVCLGGAIVECGCRPVHEDCNPWLLAYRDAWQKYVPDFSESRYHPDLNLWFAGSRFAKTKEVAVRESHVISVDDLVGRALSFSMTSPERLGNQRAQFESGLREALQPFATDGQMTEELIALAAVMR